MEVYLKNRYKIIVIILNKEIREVPEYRFKGDVLALWPT